MRVMSRNPPAASRSSAACSSPRSAASAHQPRRGEVGDVADDGDHLVVVLGSEGDDLGAELGDDRGDGGERRVGGRRLAA